MSRGSNKIRHVENSTRHRLSVQNYIQTGNRTRKIEDGPNKALKMGAINKLIPMTHLSLDGSQNGLTFFFSFFKQYLAFVGHLNQPEMARPAMRTLFPLCIAFLQSSLPLIDFGLLSCG